MDETDWDYYGPLEPHPDDVPPLQPLSNADRDFLLNYLENPPEPNDALKRAAAHYKEWYERNRDSTAE